MARKLDGDAIFFSEWNALRRSARRSRSRAKRLAEALGLALDEIPCIVVVGSKGKGTAAIYVSAALTGLGLRVGTITSPPIITNRERIRVSGVAIDDFAYAEIATVVTEALNHLPQATAETGYISPVGMYLLGGLHYFRSVGCDVVVVEAGMGGRSDEVSLLSPDIVVLTPVLGEHLGILGDDLSEIAREKLGVIASRTRAVVAAPQRDEVKVILEEVLIPVVGVDFGYVREMRNVLPPGLAALSAAAGLVACRNYVGDEAVTRNFERVRALLSTIRLPGRLTNTRDCAGRGWVVDSAVDREGVARAVEYARQLNGRVDVVLISLPDGKDIEGSSAYLDAEFGTHKWFPLALPEADHLRYSVNLWKRPLFDWSDTERLLADAHFVVAVGSWSFMSIVLSFLQMECDRVFGSEPSEHA